MSIIRIGNYQFGWYFFGRVCLVLLGFFSLKLFTSFLSIEDYAKYNLFLIIIAFLTSFLYNWIPSAAIRYYPSANTQNEKDTLKSTLNVAIILIHCFVGLVISLLVSLDNYPMSIRGLFDVIYENIFIAILIVLIIPFSTIVSQLARASQKVILFNCLLVLEKAVLILVSLAWFYVQKPDVQSVLIAMFSSYVFVVVIGIIKNKGVAFVFVKPDFSALRKYACYGFPVALAYIGTWILSASDKLIIKAFRGNYELGIYSAGYNLIDRSLVIIGMIIISVQLPIMVKEWSQGHKENCVLLLRDSVQKTLLMCLPIIVGVFLAGERILLLVTSEKFLEANSILGIIGIGSCLLSLSYLFQHILIVHEKSNVIFINTIVAAGTNIILNLLFVPQFGFKAAAWTTLASYLLLLFMTLWNSRKLLVTNIDWNSLFKVAFGTIGMSVVVTVQDRLYPMGNLSTVLMVAVGAIVYLGILLVVKEKNCLLLLNKLKSRQNTP